MNEQYSTVAREASAEITEKKSRFIAHVKNVKTEDEAIEFIESMKKKYWDATHNVYAYSIGIETKIFKSSDDGEPSGTAGVPILDVIRKSGLDDTVIVVTRYFGGTLLGTGGLVKAYSRCAKEGIIASGVEKRIWCAQYTLKLDYTYLSKIQGIASSKGFKIMNIDYADIITIDIAVPVSDTTKFEKDLMEISSGKIDIIEREKGYYIIREHAPIDD